MPTNSNSLARAPTDNAFANLINDSGDLMSRNSRILKTRIKPFLGQRVAMADATRLDLDPHLTVAGRRNLSFDKFKGTIRPGNLYGSHLRHGFSFLSLLRN